MRTILKQFSENISMRKKVIVGFCFVSLLPLLLAVYFIFVFSSKELQEDMGNYTIEITKQVTNQLDAFLLETSRFADSIRYNPSIQDFLSIRNIGADQKDVEIVLSARAILDSIGQLNMGLSGIIVINHYDQLIHSSTDRVPIYDYPYREEAWFHKNNTGLPPFNLSFHPQTYISGKPVYSYVSSISDPRYAESGTLIIDYSAQYVADFSKNITIGKTGHVIVLDSDGEYVIPTDRVDESTKNKVFANIKNDGLQKEHFILKDNGVEYLVGFSASSHTGWYSIGIVPFNEVASGIHEMRLITLFVAIGAIVFIIFLSTYVSKSITSPLLMLEQSMRKVEMGNFNFRLPVDRKDEVGKLSNRFNHMLSELDDLTHRIYIAKNKEVQLQLLNKEAELRSLQSQINPHFLYNTLNVMACIGVIRGVDEVADMSNALASMFKYSTSNHPLSTLEEEINHVRYFMKIMELRYTSPLEFITEIDDDLMQTPVLKLIIQPIVENAVFHGIEPKLSGGKICIAAHKKDEYFIIRVIDDGIGIESERLRHINELINDPDQHHPIDHHVGIQNVSRRLNFYYSGNARMTISSKVNEGTTVEMSWKEENET